MGYCTGLSYTPYFGSYNTLFSGSSNTGTYNAASPYYTPTFSFSKPSHTGHSYYSGYTPTFSSTGSYIPTYSFSNNYTPSYIPFNSYTPSFGSNLFGNSSFSSNYRLNLPQFSWQSSNNFSYGTSQNKYGLKFNFNNPFASDNSEDYSSATNYRKTKKSNLPKLELSTQRLTQMGFNTASKREGWNSLKPEMQRALVELTEYAESKGIKIGYNSKCSIFRTYAEQAQIYKTSRKGYAAKPGHSRHESGEAVDINILSGNKEGARKILGQYWEKMGYTWGGRWRNTETWHFDLRPNRRAA